MTSNRNGITFSHKFPVRFGDEQVGGQADPQGFHFRPGKQGCGASMVGFATTMFLYVLIHSCD